MASYEPEKLLSLWATEQIDIEMAMGYNLQNSVKLYQAQIVNSNTLSQLQSEVDTLRVVGETLRQKVDTLQGLIVNQIVYTGIKAGLNVYG